MLISGEELPGMGETGKPLAGRMQEGREWLTKITGRDFGYDLQAWHDHLKESREGGYTYGRNIALPKCMKIALASAEWREAAARLSAPVT
jgi:hypothetical protein